MNVQRALLAQMAAKLSPARVSVVSANSRSWASVTFCGERHEFTLLVEGEHAENVVQVFEQTLECIDFNISGNLVADIAIHNINRDAQATRLDIEALTVITD
ncbi:MAG: hypothetical protein KGJ05_09305 [Alphaproteobacteria bacterium]|nr:hypothetical protein [Alphaproteobacteria bacterium]MDE2340209.1 hypothetical protein [Alphaproteobacteria bacterium]